MGSGLCRPQHPHQAGGARPHDAERRADLPTTRAAASSPRASTWQRGRRETLLQPKAVLTIRRASGRSARGAVCRVRRADAHGAADRTGRRCAPLGSIVFESNPQAPSTVRVPAGQPDLRQRRGALPYGGTVDGVKYLYAGNEVKPDATGSAGYDGHRSRSRTGGRGGRGRRAGCPAAAERRAFVRGRAARSCCATPWPTPIRDSASAVRATPSMPSCRALPATGADRGRHGRGQSSGGPAGDHRRRRARPAGRHLYAAALDLCAVAGRVPRRLGAQRASAVARTRAAVPGSAAAGWAQPAPRAAALPTSLLFTPRRYCGAI